MGKPEKVIVEAENGEVALRLANSTGDEGALFFSPDDADTLSEALTAAADRARLHSTIPAESEADGN